MTIPVTISNKATHRYAAIHWPFIVGADEEKYQSGDECHCGNDDHVFPLELLQRFGIIATKDDEEYVDSHGECP